jgi:hypothetical protein
MNLKYERQKKENMSRLRAYAEKRVLYEYLAISARVVVHGVADDFYACWFFDQSDFCAVRVNRVGSGPFSGPGEC